MQNGGLLVNPESLDSLPLDLEFLLLGNGGVILASLLHSKQIYFLFCVEHYTYSAFRDRHRLVVDCGAVCILQRILKFLLMDKLLHSELS